MFILAKENNMEHNAESEKILKKIERKMKKSQSIVEKETGIKCTATPTNNIVICNAGLSNGLTEEQLLENFSSHGPVKRIVMLPGKSCCFLQFKNLADAETAFKAINGKLNIAQDNKPLYLGYSDSIPEAESINFNVKPPGLKIIENFVTEEEESILLSLNNFETNENNMKHRQVKHYGYEFRYDINNVDKDCPLEENIPEVCNTLWEKLKINGIDFCPDQLTVNFYKPGQGIPPHVDTHSAFEDPLLSLSLNSDTVMDFRHKDGRHLPVLLPKRSLVIMSGESRYDWTHGITPRKIDIIPSDNGITANHRGIRVSFTFRKVRQGECNCIYTERCDSFLKNENVEKIDNDIAARLEDTHVHQVYEDIANHFSETRHKPWPNVLDFVRAFKRGSILVDIGCGNGKYLGENEDIFKIGCDRSFNLIDVCHQRGFQVFNCNCLNVPLRDNIANGVICIAVIHHLANEERRRQAIKEIIRILDINGEALIYVWAKDQNYIEKSSYLKQDRKNRKEHSNIHQESEQNFSFDNKITLPVHTNRRQFQHQDLLVPWMLKSDNTLCNEFLRFYHVYEEGELEEMCKTFDNIEVVKSYYEQGNWCIIFKKIK